MLAIKSEKLLKDLLIKNGFTDENASLKVALDVFKQFAKLILKGSEDDFMWKTGITNINGEALFVCSLVRQYTLYEENDFDFAHIEVLHLNIYFNVDEVLRKLEKNEWSCDYDNVYNFFDFVENDETFQVPFNNYKPVKYEVLLQAV